MLNGKAALVTGSLDGIGFAIAERLARDGCPVMLNGFGEATVIEERVKALTALGVQADYHGADLSIPAQIEHMVAATERRFGAVDIVVNADVLAQFESEEYFERQGMQIYASTPAQLGAFAKEQIVKWDHVLRKAGIERQ